MPVSEQERGFLAHIADNPFEDNVRFIYADWLEERGDPRAELIRLQLEYDRINRGWFHRSEDPWATDLDERIQELTDLHWREWYGLVPPELHVSLNGGLLEVFVRSADDLLPEKIAARLRISSGANRQRIQEWWRLYRPWIVSLKLFMCRDRTVQSLAGEGYLNGIPLVEIRGRAVTANSFQPIRRVPSLRKLRIQVTTLGEKVGDLRPLSRLRELAISQTKSFRNGVGDFTQLTGLRSLKLEGPDLPLSTATLLQQLTQLEELSCQLTNLPDSGAFLEGMVNLQSLRLSYRNASGELLRPLTSLARLESLKIRCSVIDDAALHVLGQLTVLRRLRVDGAGILDDRAYHLRHLRHLETLDLSDMTLTTEASQHVGSLPSLRHFRWRGVNRLGSPQTFIGLTRANTLETLYLDYIDGATMEQLADLSELRNLTLRSKSVDDALLDRLPVLSKLTDLELLLSEQGCGLAKLIHQPSLIRLRLQGKALNLAHIAELRSLRSLALFYTNLHDDDLTHLQGLRQLRNLQIQNSPMTGTGFERLTQLPNLTELSCRGSPITDDAIPVLAGCPRLAHLDLTQTQVTDAGLIRLARLPHLRFVTLTPQMFWHGNITEEGVAALHAARPDIVVHFV